MGLLGDSVVKSSPVNAGDAGDASSIRGLGRSHRGGNGNPLQYSCQENSPHRGSWWAMVYRVAKSQTQQSMHAPMHKLKLTVTAYTPEKVLNFIK